MHHVSIVIARRTRLPRGASQRSGRRSESTIPKLVRRTALAQEVKKFDAFA
jgi:hypothetical protein